MILFLCIWALSALGLFALACSMSKHQKQFFSNQLSSNKTRIATIIGWCALILSLLICLSHGKPSNDISYWLGVITLAALFVATCMSYCAHHFKKIVCALGFVFVFSALIIIS